MLKIKTHYRRIRIIEISGNEFVSLDWMDCCNRYKLSHSVWREIVCDRAVPRRVGVGIMRQHQLWVSCFTTIYRHRHFA